MPLPEGFALSQPASVPEGFSLIPNPESEENKLNFLQRFQQDIDKRVGMSNEIIEAVQSGEQSTAEGVLQVAGKVGAGAIMDFIGEALVSGGRGLSAITPDIIEDPAIDLITSAGHEFLNTSVGKLGLDTAKKGIEEWNLFKINHPRAARNIEAVVDIGLLVAPVKKGAKPAPDPGLLGRAGEALGEAGVRQEAASRVGFINDLIRPKQTAAVKVEQVARTGEEGLLRQKVVDLSAGERRMSAEVATVPGVSSSKTLQGNFNIIDDAVGIESDSLMKVLRESDVKITSGEVNKSLDLARQRLQQTPLLIGDAEKVAIGLIDEAKNIVGKNPQTSAGLLQSRREFDQFIRSQKKDTIFDPNLENATSLAIKEVRQTLNSLIDIKNPTQGVRESLSKQSSLLRAMDNISPKAAQEASNSVLRAWQNVSRLLPLRGEFNQTMALMFGIGGLGAAAAFAPIFTKLAGVGIGAYAGSKFLLGPGVKKGMGALLKQIDRGIGVATDPAMIRQLRADRALIVELLKEDKDGR